MHNFDRGIVKWAPFNSVVNGKALINELAKKREKVNLPTLSDEQQKLIEEKLVNAYYQNELVTIYYFKNNYIKKVRSKIKKIDSIYHRIYLENLVLHFGQITNII